MKFAFVFFVIHDDKISHNPIHFGSQDNGYVNVPSVQNLKKKRNTNYKYDILILEKKKTKF